MHAKKDQAKAGVRKVQAGSMTTKTTTSSEKTVDYTYRGKAGKLPPERIGKETEGTSERKTAQSPPSGSVIRQRKTKGGRENYTACARQKSPWCCCHEMNGKGEPKQEIRGEHRKAAGEGAKKKIWPKAE